VQLTSFLLASLVLAITPGPGVLFVVTRSIVQGRRSGLASVAGIALGNLGNALAAALGLAAVLAMSAAAFTVIKYAGALYLVYIGVQMLRSAGNETATQELAAASPGKVFRDGIVVALLNPKTTLFFAAFLPQFFDRNGSFITQGIMLGILFVLVALVTDSIYALSAGAIAPLLQQQRSKRLGRRLGGGIFIGLGLFTALMGTQLNVDQGK
jgi:threonine/homoserine/homoserine lactone efflux protein